MTEKKITTQKNKASTKPTPKAVVDKSISKVVDKPNTSKPTIKSLQDELSKLTKDNTQVVNDYKSKIGLLESHLRAAKATNTVLYDLTAKLKNTPWNKLKAWFE